MIEYEGRVFRPPSEAYSLIVQVTIGCSHNKCTFCDMYKEKRFRVRPIEDVKADFDEARRQYRQVDRIFLADGDALMCRAEHIADILRYIRQVFPECERVTSYGSPASILCKTQEELNLLHELGLDMIYLGLESGSDEVLRRINKGETADEIVRAGLMVKTAGMKLSVTCIAGLGSLELSETHAKETAAALSRMKPEYIGLLTLLFELETPLMRDWKEGRFYLMNPVEIARETLVLLENIDAEGSVFRANHASNYVNLAGTLNRDRDAMCARLRQALDGEVRFRGEAFRAR
ncbi:MAG: radical SAM protein [Clostridia bacterium]|nr:radical SAM protein [Clostridia bacterium]